MRRRVDLSGRGNDYTAILEAARRAGPAPETGVSVLVPVYNRREMLARTLAALTHQTHPRERMQVVVADDGSSDGVEPVVERYRGVFDLDHVRQEDRGYRLAAVRNLGARAAKHDAIVLLDADVMPVPGLVAAFARILAVSDRAVLLGMRRFVDASGLAEAAILEDPGAALALPGIATGNAVHERFRRDDVSVDWRVFEYEKTDDLRRAPHPYRSLVGAVAAYPRALGNAVGGYCEEFTDWGGEDAEFGYRLYNAGAYFIPVPEAVGLHQEPPEADRVDRVAGKQRTDRLMAEKVPLWRHHVKGGYEVPKLALVVESGRDALGDQSFQDFAIVSDPDAAGDAMYVGWLTATRALPGDLLERVIAELDATDAPDYQGEGLVVQRRRDRSRA